MPDGKPDVQGMVNDPDFLKLSPADQRGALSKLTGDDSFGDLSDGDTLQFVSKMSGGMNLRPPNLPKPTVNMEQAPVSQSSAQTMLAALGRSPLRPTPQDTQFYTEHPKAATAAGVGGLALGAGAVAAPTVAGAAARAAL